MSIEQIKAAQAAEIARVMAKHASELERLEMLERAERLNQHVNKAAVPQEEVAETPTSVVSAPVAASTARETKRTIATVPVPDSLAKKPTAPAAEVAKRWGEELQVLDLAFTETIQSRMAEQHATVELAEALDRCSDCQSTALQVAHEVEELKQEQGRSEEVMLELKAKEEAAAIVELAAVRRVAEGITTTAVPETAQNAAGRKAEAARAMAVAKAREEEHLHLYEEATLRASREEANLMSAEGQVAEAEASLGQVREDLLAAERCLEKQREVETEHWLEMEGHKMKHWDVYSHAHQHRLASKEMRDAKDTAMHAVVLSHQNRIQVCQQQIREREAALPALLPAQDAAAVVTPETQLALSKEEKEKEELAALREQLREEREKEEQEKAEAEASQLAAEQQRREEKAMVQAQLQDPFHITSFVHTRGKAPPRVRQQALPCLLARQEPVLKPAPKPSSFVQITKNQAPPRIRRQRAPRAPPVSISTQTEYCWVDETEELIQWHMDGLAGSGEDEEEEEEEETEWKEAAVVFVDETPALSREHVVVEEHEVVPVEALTPACEEESVEEHPATEVMTLVAQDTTELKESPFVADLRENLLQEAYEATRLELALAHEELLKEQASTPQKESSPTPAPAATVVVAKEPVQEKNPVVEFVISELPEPSSAPAVAVTEAAAEENEPLGETPAALMEEEEAESTVDMMSVKERLQHVRDKSEGSVPRNASPAPAPAPEAQLATAPLQRAHRLGCVVAEAPIEIVLVEQGERELPWGDTPAEAGVETVTTEAEPAVEAIMQVSTRPSVAERLAALRKQSDDERLPEPEPAEAPSINKPDGHMSISERVAAMRSQTKPKVEEKVAPIGLRSPALAKIGQQFASMVAEGLDIPAQRGAGCPTSPTTA